MKSKTTQKFIRENYVCFRCSACELQSLFNCRDADFYNSGVYGWNADVYKIGNGIAIVTGYRAWGAPIPRDMLKSFETAAESVCNDTYIYTERKERLTALVNELSNELAKIAYCVK